MKKRIITKFCSTREDKRAKTESKNLNLRVYECDANVNMRRTGRQNIDEKKTTTKLRTNRASEQLGRAVGVWEGSLQKRRP